MFFSTHACCGVTLTNLHLTNFTKQYASVGGKKLIPHTVERMNVNDKHGNLDIFKNR